MKEHINPLSEIPVGKDQVYTCKELKQFKNLNTRLKFLNENLTEINLNDIDSKYKWTGKSVFDAEFKTKIIMKKI